MSINGIGAVGYPAWYGTRKAESNTKGNFGANVKEASNAKKCSKQYHKHSDTWFYG